jgi:hypothetical protein
MLNTLRRELAALGWIVRTLTFVAVAGALYQELRRPPEERTWHGTLLGVVPYDFRPPSPRRFLDAFWNPSSNRLVAAQPFGVGWALNLPVALRWVTSLVNGGGRRSGAPRRRAAKRG